MSNPQPPHEPPAWDPHTPAPQAGQPGPAGQPGYQAPPNYAAYGQNAPTPPGQFEPGAPGAPGYLQQPYPYPPQQVGVANATAGVRLVGYLIDAFLLGLANRVVNAIFPGEVWSLGDLPIQTQSGMATFLTAAISLVYFAYFNGQGQTIGKRVMRTRVVDAQTGQPIGTSRAAIRWVVAAVMSFPLMLGWLSVPFDPERRGFHDKAVNDRVIRV